MISNLLNFLATIIVAIIGLIGIWIQTRSKERQESIESKIDTLRKESKEDDERLNHKLDSAKLTILKTWLINEMTKIREGYFIPNGEQKRLIYEIKTAYNEIGGNSYVDDMFDDLRKDGLI